MDVIFKQLLRDYPPEPPAIEPGKSQQRDYENERGGVVNLFLFREPPQVGRWVYVTERHTRADCLAEQIKELVDIRYPEAKQIALMMDNLNTHTSTH